MKYLIIFIITISVINIYGQDNFKKIETNLSFYADVMINASKVDHRVKAAKLFKKQFEETLNIPGSYAYNFDSLEWISKIKSADEKFRIFTWQIKSTLDTVNYCGYIQISDGRLIELINTKDISVDIEYETFSPSRWYGQLYYAIEERHIGEKLSYTLFGYRETLDKKKQKIAENIIFSDRITFGDEIFFKEGARHGSNRIVLEYAYITQANLHFDKELNMIIFDHLIPVINQYENNEMMNVPDGTYEGYQYDKGKWLHTDRIFTDFYDEAPVPEPILKDEKKDLFGN